MDYLYIRSVFGGRTICDSKRDHLEFVLERLEGGWRFTLTGLDSETAGTLEKHREELNLFLVADGDADRKSWFYSSRGLVEVDPCGGTVKILADIRHDYGPSGS